MRFPIPTTFTFSPQYQRNVKIFCLFLCEYMYPVEIAFWPVLLESWPARPRLPAASPFGTPSLLHPPEPAALPAAQNMTRHSHSPTHVHRDVAGTGTGQVDADSARDTNPFK